MGPTFFSHNEISSCTKFVFVPKATALYFKKRQLLLPIFRFARIPCVQTFNGSGGVVGDVSITTLAFALRLGLSLPAGLTLASPLALPFALALVFPLALPFPLAFATGGASISITGPHTRLRAHLIAAQARGRRRSAWLYGLAMAVDSARLRGSGRGPMSGASANTATVSYADAHRGSDSARHCGAALYRAAHASISCSTCEEVRPAPRRTRSPTVQTRTKKGLPSLKYAMAAAGG